MGDILKPNTSESLLEQARRRRIPTIGNASSSPVPASAPVVEQPIPVEEPPVEQQPAAPSQQPPSDEGLGVGQQQQGTELPVEPAPPTLQEQQSMPSVLPSGGFQAEEPRQPNSNFGDILTAPTLQPIYEGSAEMQRRAQPEEMVEALQSIQVPRVQFANVPITGRNIITSRVEALRKANEHIVRQNRGGLQDFSVTPGGGERIFKTSAIDNALAGTGLGSILGTNLQDRLDPNRDSNTATGLLGWWQRASRYGRSLIEQDRKNRSGAGFEQIPGLAQGILGWIISNPALHIPLDNSPEWVKRREAWEQEGWRKWRETGGLDQLTNNTVAETPSGQYTLEKYGTVFDPSMGFWGDAGKNPLLSPLIYLLNIPENILMGAVYDTADALGFDKSKSWDNRTRVLGALAGRDWGVSNRWSEERYISLQEPEGKVAGDRTGNPYWDLPENIAKTFGQSESGNVSKNLHIVLQTVPALLGEVITGGISDLGVSSLAKLPSRVGDLTSLGRQMDDLEAVLPDLDIPGVHQRPQTPPKAPVVSDNSIEVPTQNIDPAGNPVVVKVETQPVVPPKAPDADEMLDLDAREDMFLGGLGDNNTIVKPVEEPPKIEVGDGQVIEVKDIPSGRRVSDNVVEGITSPKVEAPPSAENLVRRPISEQEGTELARRQGIIEPEFKRTLSEGEIAELARQQGRLFDGQTTMHPDFPRASYVTLEDGTIRQIVLSPTDDTGRVLIKETIPSVDELVELNKELDDLLKQYSVAPDAEKFDLINNLIRRREEALLRHAAEPAESAYTTRLLENELPSTQESFSTTAKIVGNEMVNTERALTSQRGVIDQLIQEVDEIKVVRNQLEEVAPTIKPVGRQNIEEALGTFEEYSEQAVPEMGFKVPEAEQFADLVGSGFNPTKPNSTTDDWVVGKLPPTEFAKKNSEMTLWFHGTSSSVPIEDMDILKGATPSEYGLGVYLTKNETVADQAALALPQVNRPPRPESIDLTPVRYTVDTSKVTRVFDLDAPMPKDIDELFYNTTVSIFGKNVADDAFRQSTTNVKLRQAWDAVRDSVYNVAGAPASEKQIREFQQVILEGFKDLDVQAGLLKSGDNPVMVVYNPKLLTPAGVPEKLPAPPYIKQYEARSWLDKLTRQTEPSNSNIHNAIQSNLDYAEQATREAAESLAIEVNKQREMLEDYIVKKDELETIIRKEQRETVRQLEATGDTSEAVQAVMRNDLAESAKTRRQRARKTSEAKDYSVPKAKRGKNPPAVSDKPISKDVLPDATVSSGKSLGRQVDLSEKKILKPEPEAVPVALNTPTSQVVEAEIDDLWKQYESAKLTNNESEKTRILNVIDDKYESIRVEKTEVSLGLPKDFFKDEDLLEADQLAEQLEEVSDELFDRTEDILDKAPKDDAVVEQLSVEIDDLWKQYESATSVEKIRILKELEGKSDELIRRTEGLEPSRQAEFKPEPEPDEAVPVEVVVEPIGVPLEGKRVPLGDRIRAEADKIREATKQEAEALVKILDNAGKISENYENLVTEVSQMVQDDLDEATLRLGEGVPVPSFKVKAGTQKAYIKDWQAAGQAGVYKFGDKTEFSQKYSTRFRFTVDAGKTGQDLSFVENTFENQKNFQNILDGKNPAFDHKPFPEWVPSTGELTNYYDWTDYAKQYTDEKYTINNSRELATKRGGGVSGYEGMFVDLGSRKLFQDRQDEFLIKYADAKTSDGASVPSEMLENTHWNLESFKRLKQGKKPIGDPNANPATEWVPSTGELKAYKSWDDYADQYSVSKYTRNSTTTPVSPKVKSTTKQDRMVDSLLKNWDDLDLDDVRSADKQAKKFTVPELDDPCL